MKKYETVEQWVKDEILEKRLLPGDKLPTESSLCQLLEVSRNSVREALHRLAQDGWIERRKGVGAICIQKLETYARDVGIVCYYTDRYIWPRIIQGCDRLLYRYNMHLILNHSEYDLEKEKDILQKLRKRRVAGIVLEPIYGEGVGSNRVLVKELEEEGIPIVLLDNYYPDPDLSVVAQDDYAGGRLAAEHLWNRGHRKIAYTYESNYYPKAQRMQGAWDLVKELGGEINEQWIVELRGPRYEPVLTSRLDGLFSSGKPVPSAFLCSNDAEALTVIRKAKSHSLKVPKDISVIGFDDSDLAKLSEVPITSISHPAEVAGEAAINILLSRMQHPRIRSVAKSIFKPTLVERESVSDSPG